MKWGLLKPGRWKHVGREYRWWSEGSQGAKAAIPFNSKPDRMFARIKQIAEDDKEGAQKES